MGIDSVVPAAFRRQLAETIEWCVVRATEGGPDRLRSQELRPDTAREESSAQALCVSSELITGVVETRRRVLAELGWAVTVGATNLAGGRLLVSAYEYTNHNGASAGATGDYLDEDDVPPWDTWIGEVAGLQGGEDDWPPTLASHLGDGPPNRGLLVSWVPRAFIPVIQAGLEVECMGMLCWADQPSEGHGGSPRFGQILPRWLCQLAKTVSA
jgi:hypothetical protein